MDRRVRFERGLSSLYLPRYRMLANALPAEWQPYCGVRDFSEQDRLYAQGRTDPGKIVTRAKGGESGHNYGCASDWTIFQDGKPLWLKRDDARWEVYRDACKAAGLRWGGDWNANGVRDPNDTDLFHNELPLTCAWKHVLLAYQQTNMTGAQEKIERSLEV